MLNLKRILLFVIIGGTLGVCSVSAQQQLERISITERGDGNGYVIRYHLTEMVDSHDLIQPEMNRVQMQLFSTDLAVSGIEMPVLNDEITALHIAAIQGGIGVDITIADNVYFIAEAYPDQNMRDLLLNLEYATRAQAEARALESNLYEWAQPEETLVIEEVSEEPQENLEEPDSEPKPQEVVQREPVTANIGIIAGLGIASKLGGDYTAESRQEFVMGLSVGITLPFMLIHSLNTGIETGVYFTQKGFLNPSIDRFDGESILLDYIEIPVLLRLHYDLTGSIKPKVLGGFYTAFRANSEVLQSDGDRININDNTNTVDVGLIGGVGADVLVRETTISLQVQYGIGIPAMFPNDFSGNERQGYFSLLMGVRF